ncbi:MAG: hypothetical protein ACRC37_04580 [Lentisphaeria bacterium]
MLNLPWLMELTNLHATPGDEKEVRDYMTSRWNEMGLKVNKYGSHAISVNIGNYNQEKPTILICAHMDSPGFIIEKVDIDSMKVVKLGGPHFHSDEVPAKVRTSNGTYPTKLRQIEIDGEKKYICNRVVGAIAGDRVCYDTTASIDADGIFKSAFLDDRAGCFLLLEIAKKMQNKDLPFNLVLGVNGTEEMCGFGARVLATKVQPDFVICLDATYCNKDQNIQMGKGPVLTISDASVLISIEQRDIISEIFYDFGIHFQSEVYNYSGTDAKAFPNVGLQAPTIALLLPTLGNHEPIESCDLEDLESWLEASITLAERAFEYELF